MLGRITSTTSTLLPSYDARNPPSYSPANSSSAAPPPITWPAKYRVGSHGVRLVSTDEVKRHLTLLASFDKLRRAVEEMEAPKWCAQVETKPRWALFVRVAVNRFEKYLDSLYRRNAQEIDPPPLDVALVLHTYLLNPGRYHEDSIRGDLALGKTKDLMLTRIVNTIDAVTLIQTVTDVAMQEWEERTKTRWDPLANFLETKGIVLTLPETTVNPGGEALVPWLDGGRGYAEEGFEVKKGSQIWTHELLGLHSLAFDLNNCRLSSLSTLAGTVVSSSDAPDLPSQSRRAKYVRQKLYDQMPVKICSSPQDMFRILGSRQGAEVLLRAALGPKNEGGVRNILACYSRGERFSLDLGMAVLRQGVFVDKMKTLGWLNTDRFKGDDTLLRRSIARYHAFLDLIFSSSSMFCVPTLDIDLAWHTHQLKRLYREDTIALGRFVQHEDKVEETALGNAFDATAQAWQTRFGIPYSTCGCPLPSQRPLTRLSSALGRAPSHLKTVYPAGTLSHTVDDNGGTHGSEHNSILLPFHPQAVKARKAREKELEVRRRKEAAEKAKRARRGAPTGDFDDEGEKRRKQHGIAFLAPVPLIAFGAGVGAGVGFGTAGGCVAFEANVSWNGLDQGRSGGSGCGGGSSGACVSASQIGSCGSSVSSCASCGGGSGGDGGIGSGGGGGGCGGGSSGGGGDGGGGGGGGCGGGS